MSWKKKLPNGVYLFQSLLVGNLVTPLCDNWQGSGVAKHDLGAIALMNSKKAQPNAACTTLACQDRGQGPQRGAVQAARVGYSMGQGKHLLESP